MTGNFGLEILWLVLYCFFVVFYLAVGVYAVPEKEIYTAMAKGAHNTSISCLVIIQVYLTCCVASSMCTGVHEQAVAV